MTPQKTANHVLISSVKDEGPFMLEWVAHHRILGFDRIIIASNDCRDGTDGLLDALAAAGHIAHVRNVLQPGEIPQHAGYKRIRAAHDIDSADWLMMLDADEFLNVHVGSNRVADLTAMADTDVDVVALYGMCFTDQPHLNWTPGRVCPRFVARMPIKSPANATLKTLTKNPARFRGIHNHHMVGFRSKVPLQVLGGDGQRFEVPLDVPLWQVLRSGTKRTVAHAFGQYNHYSIKTWDSFMVRKDRGRGAVAITNDETARHTEDYFLKRQETDGQDVTIARYDAEVTALMAAMLADPVIAAQQARTEAMYAALAAPYRR